MSTFSIELLCLILGTILGFALRGMPAGARMRQRIGSVALLMMLTFCIVMNWRSGYLPSLADAALQLIAPSLMTAVGFLILWIDTTPTDTAKQRPPKPR